MRHQSLEHLKTLADVGSQPGAMTRLERLEHWAQLLERNPERKLQTLERVEYMHAPIRETMRKSDSPITVAFEDPCLRAEGMTDDSYGEAKRFFELSDRQLHDIVCYCHFGETVRSANAAQGVRLGMVKHRSLLSRLWTYFR